ncbi:MAG TPA: UDP-N-acetylmuramate dehydrogenase [Gemmatimonadales bacterium]|jgi:UDP-N-acetylmuramate dehydrogenase|nr:UDP-N-acetylmuramate dehydrogenase [Gemmatimonadales bacterium]
MSARDPRFAAALGKAVRGVVTQGVPLARYSTYRIGGPATVFLAASPEDLAAGLCHARRAGVPVFALGLGSNVLLPDAGLDALVIRFGKGLDGVRSEGARWWLGAGLPAPLAARRTAEQGWAGVHLMVGVPGTVGGGVFMNAGCHGGQWSDVVQAITVLGVRSQEPGVRVIPAREIPFSYRRSGLEGMLVLEAEVLLRPGDPAELGAEVQRLFAWRQVGTPFNQPCCGSVFKNPAEPAPAGWERPWTAGSLLEAAGLKGMRVGGAEVSRLHANYFVNSGSATAQDVIALIRRAREVVGQQFAVALETEVKLIGVQGEYLSSDQ